MKNNKHYKRTIKKIANKAPYFYTLYNVETGNIKGPYASFQQIPRTPGPTYIRYHKGIFDLYNL